MPEVPAPVIALEETVTQPRKLTSREPLPLAALEPAGSPVVVHYDLAEPTSVRGRQVIQLDGPAEYFTGGSHLTREQISAAYVAARDTGVLDPVVFPANAGLDRWRDDPNGYWGDDWVDWRTRWVRAVFKALDEQRLVDELTAGKRLVLYVEGLSPNNGGTVVARFEEVVGRRPALLLVERYRLSSFPARYGAGRTIKTFSLLPGERTRIRISTYKRTSESRQEASSILDASSDETERAFESTVQAEQSDRQASRQSQEYHVEGEVQAEARWGWGSAQMKVSGGTSSTAESSREEFVKNVSNAVNHNAAKASSRREIHVDTSLEVETESAEESAIERDLENINRSRTLNFIFRQMNQEFIAVLHLVDVRVAYFDGTAGSRDERPLFELDRLLERYVVADRRAEVRAAILAELSTIKDSDGRRADKFIDKVTVRDGDTETELTYPRVNPGYESTYQPAGGGREIRVPGVLVSAEAHVMRTDGVVVDAFLGQGNGLDDYSTGLQVQAIRERRLANDLRRIEVDRLRLANEILRDGDRERADLYGRLFPRPQIINQVEQAAISDSGAGQAVIMPNGHGAVVPAGR